MFDHVLLQSKSASGLSLDISEWLSSNHDFIDDSQTVQISTSVKTSGFFNLKEEHYAYLIYKTK